MRKFQVSFTSTSYTCIFYYHVVAESREAAEKAWESHLNEDSHLAYAWKSSIRDCCGFTKWKDEGSTDMKPGVYEVKKENTFFGSDHLND